MGDWVAVGGPHHVCRESSDPRHAGYCACGKRMDAVREFDTGATRDTDEGKYDYEGFLSPVVLEQFAAYMHKHRVQSDGSLRDSDNWQKGIPLDAYMKSMFRHFMDVWSIHRGRDSFDSDDELIEALCALFFNVQGYLYEVLDG